MVIGQRNVLAEMPDADLQKRVTRRCRIITRHRLAVVRLGNAWMIAGGKRLKVLDAEIDGDKLSDQEVLGFLFLMVVAIVPLLPMQPSNSPNGFVGVAAPRRGASSLGDAGAIGVASATGLTGATAGSTRATMAGGSTAFYQMYLAEQRKDPSTPLIPSLRKLSGGGAPMPPEVYEEVTPSMVTEYTVELSTEAGTAIVVTWAACPFALTTVVALLW